jgi:hypothetical protein
MRGKEGKKTKRLSIWHIEAMKNPKDVDKTS